MSSPDPAVHAQPARRSEAQCAGRRGAALQGEQRHGYQEVPDVSIPSTTADDADEWRDIDLLIFEHYESTVLDAYDRVRGYNFVAELEARVNNCDKLTKIFKGSKLSMTVVGLFRSGSTSKFSNLKVCLRFVESPVSAPREVFERRVLETIQDCIARCYCTEVFWDTERNRPTVKFFHSREESKFCVNISYYCLDELYNSELIRQFGQCLPLLRVLLIWTDAWAKSLGISADTRKALEPFGYAYMVIHFLQRSKPAVLPYLQVRSSSKRTFDTKKLSPGKLFTGFLDYFSQFNYEEAISIRKRNPTIRGLKRGFLNIEDPFSPSENIARWIEEPMHIHMLKCIKRSREVFVSPATRSMLAVTPAENKLKLLLDLCAVTYLPQINYVALFPTLSQHIQEPEQSTDAP